MPDYKKIKKLGEGKYGEVWLVYDRALGVERSVKYVDPAKIHDPTEFYKEPQTLMQLKHSNIVRVEDAGKEDDGTLYIAMEYLPRGSLKDAFKGNPVPLRTARRYICDICRGLEYAHQKGYIHRDIKPSNILIGKKGEGKLSDFGLASRDPKSLEASPYGYIIHLAPEVFYNGHTTKLTDIYALGVTAYRIFNGDEFLPAPHTFDEFVDLVIDEKYPERKRYRPYVPRYLRRIVNKAMNSDPTKRYQSASAFRRDLDAVSIHCNWGWKRHKSSIIYKATIRNVRVKTVVRHKPDRKFDIITTKKSGDGPERCVRKDCAEGLTLNKMKSTLHKILSRYVTEGR